MLTTNPHGDVLARFGHALSDATRSRILLTLCRGPAYPAELADSLGVSRTNLSNHLSCLRACGLVLVVQQGRRARYELADQRLSRSLWDLLDLAKVIDPLAGSARCHAGRGSPVDGVAAG